MARIIVYLRDQDHNHANDAGKNRDTEKRIALRYEVDIGLFDQIHLTPSSSVQC